MNASTIGKAVAVFITLPIWFYLLFQILKAVEADSLMWFLYWVYVPFTLFVTTVIRIASDD